MVRSQNYRSFKRDTFRIVNPPTKVEFVNQPKNTPAKEVDEVHGYGVFLFVCLVLILILVILIEPLPDHLWCEQVFLTRAFDLGFRISAFGLRILRFDASLKFEVWSFNA
jgi:hypothetical protein